MSDPQSVPRSSIELTPRRSLPVEQGEFVPCADRRLVRAMVQHTDRLASLLQRTRLGSGDADDIVQEAFWVLARRLADVPEPAEGAFLKTTVLRLAADRRRSGWYRVMNEPPPTDAWHTDAESTEKLWELAHAQRRVDVALTALTNDERDVLALVELESMSRQEAACLLGVPAGTVASRLARARTRFEAVLASTSAWDVVPQDRGQRCPDDTRTEGNQRFETNAWGHDKQQRRFDQRLVERRRNGGLQLGWFWRWPGFEPTVYAYPEVLIGWKPWCGGAPTDPRLPVRVSDALKLRVDYAVETYATGSYNLAVSAWISNRPGWSMAADPNVIATEIMVWPHYTPGATPLGTLIGTVKLEGEPYELWRADGIGERTLRNDRGWTAFTFRGTGGRTRGELALGALLSELLRRRAVRRDQHLTSVELGNEVMGGAGSSFVERFSVELR